MNLIILFFYMTYPSVTPQVILGSKQHAVACKSYMQFRFYILTLWHTINRFLIIYKLIKKYIIVCFKYIII